MQVREWKEKQNKPSQQRREVTKVTIQDEQNVQQSHFDQEYNNRI